MPEEISHQEQAERRSGLWISLAVGLVLLIGLIATGCKNSANSNTADASGGAGAKTEPSPGTVVKNSIGMEFAYVPAGSFKMGTDNGAPWEKPVHQVTFARGFYMGRYEVTQAQWQKVMGNNPTFDLKSRACGENCPVDNMSWNDIQEFIKKLNAANDGYTYRLPSEAEWEYACRAGTTGDETGDFDSMAWYKANANNTVHPVGQKKPNAWGLYDMHGNVFEWVMDNSHDSYDGAPTDGSAWSSGGQSDKREERGGSYTSDTDDLRSSRRWGDDPSGSGDHGFRVAAIPRS
jgi:formylglycine-generating enzyme required for sulfatase activity